MLRVSDSSSLLLPLFLGLFVGCGGVSDRPETFPVTGTVTYKGVPAPKLSVAFMPSGGGAGMIAGGTTDAEGKFTLTTQGEEGAKVGEYDVVLVPVPDEIPDMFADTPPEDAAEATDAPIPQKYGDVQLSGLKVSVTNDSEKNVFTFDLE